jgi:hypothetical protein
MQQPSYEHATETSFVRPLYSVRKRLHVSLVLNMPWIFLDIYNTVDIQGCDHTSLSLPRKVVVSIQDTSS